jgi:hypothetical protein
MVEGSKPYNAAELNMDRLIAFAKRVARETRVEKTASVNGKRATEQHDQGVAVELFGPHWSLLQVTSNGETSDYPNVIAEWHMRKHWLLATDGTLHVVEYHEKFAQYGAGRGSWRFDPSVRVMTRNDVLELDHDHPNLSGEHRAKKERWWGNYGSGKLRAHAPGVAASIALKRLLGGN